MMLKRRFVLCLVKFQFSLAGLRVIRGCLQEFRIAVRANAAAGAAFLASPCAMPARFCRRREMAATLGSSSCKLHRSMTFPGERWTDCLGLLPRRAGTESRSLARGPLAARTTELVAGRFPNAAVELVGVPVAASRRQVSR